MADVVAIGELLIDFSAQSTDADGYPTLAAHPGGAPANFLAALAKYGCTAALIAKVGDDAFGRLLGRTLASAGVDTRGLRMDPDAFTTLAFVTNDAAGERQFSFARKPGADMLLRYGDVDMSLIDEARLLHFGTLSMTDEPALSTTMETVSYARAKGKLISFDPNLREPLWRDMADARKRMEWGLRHADIVKISDDELAFLLGCEPADGAERLIGEYGLKLVFVTAGSRGCYYQNARCRGHVDAFTAGIHTKDTTGAGDIFNGAAVSRLLQTGRDAGSLDGDALREIMRFASAAAGLSTERCGGISSIPEEKDVLRLLQQKPLDDRRRSM